MKKERAEVEAKAWDGIMEKTDKSHFPMEDVKPIIDSKKSKPPRDEMVCHLPLFLVLTPDLP